MRTIHCVGAPAALVSGLLLAGTIAASAHIVRPFALADDGSQLLTFVRDGGGGGGGGGDRGGGRDGGSRGDRSNDRGFDVPERSSARDSDRGRGGKEKASSRPRQEDGRRTSTRHHRPHHVRPHQVRKRSADERDSGLSRDDTGVIDPYCVKRAGKDGRIIKHCVTQP